MLGFVKIPNFVSYLEMMGLISALVIAHEFGHFTVAKKVGVKVERFGFGLPIGPTLFEKQIGETTFCIHPVLLGGYVSFPDDDPDSTIPKDSPRRFENRSIPERTAIAIAGVVVNFIMGYLLMVLVLSAWGYPSNLTGIQQVLSPTAPAAQAGLMAGDVFLKVGTTAIEGPETLINTFAQYKQKPVEIEIRRNKVHQTLTVTPNAKGKIDVALKPILSYIPLKSPVEVLSKSYTYLAEKMVLNFHAVGEIFTGKRSIKELSGPVGIIGEGGRMIQSQGLPVGLIITALISVILAIMNILPVPMLDGGHLLFMAIELIQGHPLKKEIQEKVVQGSFVVLMCLMVFILWNDINTHILGK